MLKANGQCVDAGGARLRGSIKSRVVQRNENSLIVAVHTKTLQLAIGLGVGIGLVVILLLVVIIVVTLSAKRRRQNRSMHSLSIAYKAIMSPALKYI